MSEDDEGNEADEEDEGEKEDEQEKKDENRMEDESQGVKSLSNDINDKKETKNALNQWAKSIYLTHRKFRVISQESARIMSFHKFVGYSISI